MDYCSPAKLIMAVCISHVLVAMIKKMVRDSEIMKCVAAAVFILLCILTGW